jgi:hypothetical protein
MFLRLSRMALQKSNIGDLKNFLKYKPLKLLRSYLAAKGQERDKSGLFVMKKGLSGARIYRPRFHENKPKTGSINLGTRRCILNIVFIYSCIYVNISPMYNFCFYLPSFNLSAT